MNSRNRCVVVIPAYKSDMSVEEERSFQNTLAVLGNWDIRLIVPENVSVAQYARMKPFDALNFAIVRVSNQWMRPEQGRNSYNTMMLSTDFYRLFDDYEYILICHLDSWVFRDELKYWINLGYDYVGPPLFLLKEPGRNSLESLVAPQGGNGGFCLRKIDSTVKLLSKARYNLNVMLFLKGVVFLIRNRKLDLLKIFLRICWELYKDPVQFQSRYNVFEDVMISVCYALLYRNYRAAPPEIAMHFGTEVYSEELIQTKLKLRLPFAVHAYGKYFLSVDEFVEIRDNQRRNDYARSNLPDWHARTRQLPEPKPLVTIVTATYNLVSAGRVDTFRQCIESVHSQDYENYEHIIIDGSSSDGTLDLINEYVQKGWCVCFSEPDSGVWEALRKGQERAKGKYINFMNSDDFFSSPRAISIAVNSMIVEKADWFYSEGFIMARDGTTYDFPTDVYGVFSCLGILHQSMFVRTDILRAVDPFASNHVTRENYFMMLLCVNGIPFSYSRERLVTYREGGFSSVDYSREGGEIASSDFAKYFYRIAGRYWGMNESECLSMHGWKCFSKKEYGRNYAWDLSGKLLIGGLRSSFRRRLASQRWAERKRRWAEKAGNGWK